MKVLQIFTFYYDYLEDFHRRRPDVAGESHTVIIRELQRDGFGAIHFYAEDLPRDQYSVECVIANDPVSQAAWLRDRSIGAKLKPLEIVMRQVNESQPDVLLVVDPVNYESRFVRRLNRRPKLVVGWRAATVPHGVDWTEFDAIFSNHEPSLQLALKLGAAQSIRFQPGFPKFIADDLAGAQRAIDVSFTGSLSSEHTRRINLLTTVAKERLGLQPGFSFEVYADSRPDLSPDLNACCCGSRWGMKMYRTLAESRINLNSDPDFTDPRSANMRQFEVTGCGGFLLTEYKDSIQEYFQPGKEIETFKSSGEAMEKIKFYLAHPEEREKIAANGQSACLERFPRKNSAVELSKIFQGLQHKNNLGRRIKRGMSLLTGSKV